MEMSSTTVRARVNDYSQAVHGNFMDYMRSANAVADVTIQDIMAHQLYGYKPN
jgi:hypothetical protein